MFKQIVESAKKSVERLSNYLLLFFLVLLFLSLVRNTFRINKAKDKVQKAEERLEKLREEKEELELKLKFVKSEEFIEKQVRDKLGLVREGEIVVILPEDEIVKKFAPLHYEEEEVLPDPNWKKWMQLFIY